MGSNDLSRMGTGFDIGIILWTLLKTLCRIHVLLSEILTIAHSVLVRCVYSEPLSLARHLFLFALCVVHSSPFAWPEEASVGLKLQAWCIS